MSRKQRFLTVLVVCAVAYGFLCASPAAAKVEGDNIIFGAALSFTGKYSTNGKHTKNGYDLVVKRINEMGGVKVGGKTYKIEIKYYDDESTPARAGQLADRLIKQDDIKFILGPYGSGPTKGMAPITEKYKIPMVEGNGASRSLFNKGYTGTYLPCSPLRSSTWQNPSTCWQNSSRRRAKTRKRLKWPLRWKTIPFPWTSEPGLLMMPNGGACKWSSTTSCPRS